MEPRRWIAIATVCVAAGCAMPGEGEYQNLYFEAQVTHDGSDIVLEGPGGTWHEVSVQECDDDCTDLTECGDVSPFVVDTIWVLYDDNDDTLTWVGNPDLPNRVVFGVNPDPQFIDVTRQTPGPDLTAREQLLPGRSYTVMFSRKTEGLGEWACQAFEVGRNGELKEHRYGPR